MKSIVCNVVINRRKYLKNLCDTYKKIMNICIIKTHLSICVTRIIIDVPGNLIKCLKSFIVTKMSN